MIQGMRETVGLLFHEFSDLSVDATVNIMQSISGNVPEGKTGSRLPEQERCCLTAKGRTGSVLAIEPIRAEDFAELLRGLETAVPLNFRGRVLSVCTDSPKRLLSDTGCLLATFPNLRCVSEDPVHARLRLETCSGNQANQVSILVQGINMDLFQRPKERQAGETFRWDDQQVTEDGEAARRAYTAGLLTSPAEAQEIISRALTMEGSPADYGMLLAAAGVIGANDMTRRNGKGQDSRTLGEILEAQCDHYSYLRNHALRRGEMTQTQQEEKACGTASNEAFHKEVGVWGQRITRQTRRLLGAKLRVLLFLKLSTFIFRKLHTRAHAQGYIAAVVAAQLADGRDLKLLREDDAEYRVRQEKELAAKDRERVYCQREKVRKTRLALSRGISFVYPRRGDGLTARAVARARTFQSRTLRSSGRPEQKKHAERSKHWRSEVRQRSEVSGLPWVRKRKSFGPMSARAANVAKFLAESKVSNAATEPAQPELIEAGARNI